MPTETNERPSAVDLAAIVAALPPDERERFDAALRETTFATARNAPDASLSGVPAEVLAKLRAEAAEQSLRLRELYAKWDAEPANREEPSFEEHMVAINENRRATGERLIY